MSICGHVTLSPDQPAMVERMLRVITLTGTRSQRQWAGDGVRLACADEMSLATGAGGRAALLSGQIHNVAELRTVLGLEAGMAREPAALLLAAHARWGDDCVDHVIGDYAIAVWEGARRRLLLAVDPGGYRPLMFALAPDGIRFASETRGLLAEPAVDREIDDVRVAHWLTLMPPPDGRTFHKGVCRVAPGTRAVWQDGRVTSERWWYPEKLPMLQLKDHRDYAASVRAALEVAVACRLGDDTTRVGSMLSGGLDSATVTALAARQLGAAGRPLSAFTATPAHGMPNAPGRFNDEWSHAAQVAALYPNIEHVRISNDDMPLVDMLELREPAQDAPLFNVSNSVWINAIDRQARDRGLSVMLSGSMGNMTFSYDGTLHVAQLLHGGRISAGIAAARRMQRVQGRRFRWFIGHLADSALPATPKQQTAPCAGQRRVGVRRLFGDPSRFPGGCRA